MPATGLQATGSGAPRFAVVIEGVPYAWVNTAADATSPVRDPYNSEDFTFYAGLVTHDWEFSESVDLVAAQVDVKSVQLKIVDVGGAATACFDANPSVTTWLAADFTDTETTSITVLDTSLLNTLGLPRPVHVGLETILVDVIDATHLEPGTRGMFRSYPTYHYTSTGSSVDTAYAPITDRPTFFEGRRVEFFAYDENETITIDRATDTGDTPFWVGIITAEPSYDGTTWSLQVDHISSRLKQKIGADLSRPRGIRGIYYPVTNPFAIQITQGVSTAYWAGIDALTHVVWCGFAESQQAWCDSVNALIATALTNHVSGSGFVANTKVRIEPDASTGKWRIRVDTPAADARYIHILGLGPGQQCSRVDQIAQQGLVDANGNGAVTVANNTSYYALLTDPPDRNDAGTVPRAFFSASALPSFITFGDRSTNRVSGYDPDTNPSNRLYLDADVNFPGSSTSAQVEWQSGDGTRATGNSIVYQISAVSSSSQYVDLAVQPGPGPYGITPSSIPKITFSIWLGSGSLADLFDAIVSAAPRYAPLGTIPMIQANEIDAGDIRAVASSNALAGNRSWTIATAKDLLEIVAQECRLLGVFPTTSSTGALTFKRLRFATGGEAASASLGVSDFLSENGSFYTLQRQPYGVVNAWTLVTGYNPQSDKNEGRTITVVDVESRSNAGRTREIRITPFSQDPDNVPVDSLFEQCQRLAANLLGVLGGPYRMLTCRVPLTRWSLRGGDTVSLTWPRLPDGTGSLGTTARQGLVVGRTMHVRAGYIELVMLVTGLRVAGYSPGAKVTVDSGASGGTGPFAVTPAAGYLPSGDDPTDFWTVGDKIRVFRFDDSTPTIVTGTVTVVSTTQITFTTDAAWSHSGHSWFLGSQVSTSITSTHQKLYAYDATSASIADFSDEDVSSYVFS